MRWAQPKLSFLSSPLTVNESASASLSLSLTLSHPSVFLCVPLSHFQKSIFLVRAATVLSLEPNSVPPHKHLNVPSKSIRVCGYSQFLQLISKKPNCDAANSSSVMTMVVGLCQELRDRVSDRCLNWFPCLSDPARRSSLCLKVALVMIHLIYVGVLFLLDSDNLVRTAKRVPWYFSIFCLYLFNSKYIGLYLFLYVATLVQYFVTAGSSPGYVIDAMRAVNERDSLLRAPPANSKQPATYKSGGIVVTIDRNPSASSATSWTKLVMEMYPPGSSMRQWTCTYCSVLQPPRAKHCHDCDKCILQFDHHCVWLGTCIGQANHCRFWWYILEETTLCLWTVILYIAYLKANISRSWHLNGNIDYVLFSLIERVVILSENKDQSSLSSPVADGAGACQFIIAVDGCDHDTVAHYIVYILGLSCSIASISQIIVDYRTCLNNYT
ncbi:hypothetical protein Cgig2_033655 [Carnegiea gigantea]|uniref:S-acyltransferase n=1 Tax=Carnegiea gigantea TaxID=171969 RepID=A0A9Q1JZ82_9CARY|nr:hypothetical protein Cgig2_033655 [Carnegiea gigantea]